MKSLSKIFKQYKGDKMKNVTIEDFHGARCYKLANPNVSVDRFIDKIQELLGEVTYNIIDSGRTETYCFVTVMI